MDWRLRAWIRKSLDGFGAVEGWRSGRKAFGRLKVEVESLGKKGVGLPFLLFFIIQFFDEPRVVKPSLYVLVYGAGLGSKQLERYSTK